MDDLLKDDELKDEDLGDPLDPIKPAASLVNDDADPETESIDELIEEEEEEEEEGFDDIDSM